MHEIQRLQVPDSSAFQKALEEEMDQIAKDMEALGVEYPGRLYHPNRYDLQKIQLERGMNPKRIGRPGLWKATFERYTVYEE